MVECGVFGTDVTEGKKKKHFKHRSPRQGNTLKTSSNSSPKSEEPREVCVHRQDEFGLGRSWPGKLWGVADGPALYWRPWQVVGCGENPRCRKGMCSVSEAETNAACMEQGGVARNSFL